MGYMTIGYCDICKKEERYDFNIGRTAMAKDLQRKGWKVGKQWRCPDCKDKIVQKPRK